MTQIFLIPQSFLDPIFFNSKIFLSKSFGASFFRIFRLLSRSTDVCTLFSIITGINFSMFLIESGYTLIVGVHHFIIVLTLSSRTIVVLTLSSRATVVHTLFSIITGNNFSMFLISSMYILIVGVHHVIIVHTLSSRTIVVHICPVGLSCWLAMWQVLGWINWK